MLDALMSGASRVDAHAAWWTTGAALGALASLGVLRWRGLLHPRVLIVFLVAGALLQIGAKWQYRLQTLPLWEALTATPSEFYEPGMRMPLGLLLGGFGALASAAILRVPWRELGDALCIGGSVMLAVGRLGCFAAGCCMGTVCPVWMYPICLRLPAGTDVHNQQLRADLISLASPESLPVHALPAYFALASLFTLGVLVLLVRRGAPPGAPLLAFVILGSASKLALEFLRGSAPQGPAGLMLWLPVIGVASGLAAWLVVARRSRPAAG